MLLRLSRFSFWLAAAVAAFALIAPDGREQRLTAITAAAGILALVLLHLALRDERPGPVGRAAPTTAPVLAASVLLDAAAELAVGVNAAASFELALHGVARLLRSEVGARSAAVISVHAVSAHHADVSDLIEFQPGFKSVPRRIRLDATPLAQVLRHRGEAVDLPVSAALAVRAAGRVVAAIELRGLNLAVEPRALAGLLDAAQRSLSQVAARQANTAASAGPSRRRAAALQRRAQLARAQVPVIVGEGAVQPEPTVRMLRRVGCRVGVAFGTLDGLNALRRTQFGLILIDMQVPRVAAVEALNRLRANPDAARDPVPVCDTPVIALSGPGLPGDEERFRELGFDDHLSKPLRRREMLAMLSKHLRSPEPAASNDKAGAEPVLDPLALARLGELDPNGENHLLERVLRAFQTSVARLRPQLDAARRSDDRAAIRLVAHTLKSSSASIGALHLSQLCAQIETAIRLEAHDDPRGPLVAFDGALDSTLQAIDTLIRERA